MLHRKLCLLALTGSFFMAQKAQAVVLWGAIASSYDTLTEAQAIGDRSLYDTLQEALASCRSKARGQECFSIATVASGCVAWAVDRKGHWGWAQNTGGPQTPEASLEIQKKALEHCNKNNPSETQKCQVVRTLCTDEGITQDSARNGS